MHLISAQELANGAKEQAGLIEGLTVTIDLIGELFTMRKFIAFCSTLVFTSMLFFGQSAFAADATTCELEESTLAFNIVYPEGCEIPENFKIVYLTFDDGPTKYTPKILEILAQHDVPATFFVVGNTEYTHYIRDIAENSHAIGLHCYNHKFEQIYSSKEAYFNDLKKIDDIVYDHTGYRSMIIRFPGGSSIKRGTNKWFMKQLSSEVRERGYQYFDWNCDSGDANGTSSASVALTKIKSMEKEVGDIVIVLMHDTKGITVEYLPAVIEHFKELGYTFSRLCPASPAVHHSW